MSSPYPALRRELLGPLADRHGMSYDLEVFTPDENAAQRAFRFVGFGCDILGRFIYKDAGYFPSTDRGTRRKGSRLVRRSFAGDGARAAAVFLAQSLGWWIHETFLRAGDINTAGFQLRSIETVQDRFPLGAELLECLNQIRAEYRTLDQHALRREVVIGAEIGTGYHMALRDPGWLEGREPDDDASLVEAQERYASQFLRRTAEMFAIETTIGRHAYSEMECKLLKPGTLQPEELEQDLASLGWWTNIAGDWLDAAQETNKRIREN